MAVNVILLLMFAYETFSHSRRISWLPASLISILTGIAIGATLEAAAGKGASRNEVEFDETQFLLVLLPVIIFESGFSLKKKFFTSQLGPILVLALVGTLISTVVVACVLEMLSIWGASGVDGWHLSEAFAFGALISAVDPVASLSVFRALKVDPVLNGLVYGESVLNDGVSIVLYRFFIAMYTSNCDNIVHKLEEGGGRPYWASNGFEHCFDKEGEFIVSTDEGGTSAGDIVTSVLSSVLGVGLGSPVCGWLVVCVYTLAARYMHLDACVSGILLLLCCFMSFHAAEALGWSGIIASVTAGMLARHYMRRNMVADGAEGAEQVLKVLAAAAETFVFVLVGIDSAILTKHLEWSFFGWTFLLIIVGRVINVGSMSTLLNLLDNRKSRPPSVPWQYQAVLAHAGLRGAIAYALAIQFPGPHGTFVHSTTSLIIVATVLIFGSTCGFVVRWLNVPMDVEPAELEQLARENASLASGSAFGGDEALEQVEGGAKLSRAQQEARLLERGKTMTLSEKYLTSTKSSAVRGHIFATDPGAAGQSAGKRFARWFEGKMVHLLLRPAAVQAMLDESRVKSEGGASGSPDKVAAAGSNVNERSLSAADGGPIMHSSTTTRQTNPLFSGSPRDGGRGSLASQLQ